MIRLAEIPAKEAHDIPKRFLDVGYNKIVHDNMFQPVGHPPDTQEEANELMPILRARSLIGALTSTELHYMGARFTNLNFIG